MPLAAQNKQTALIHAANNGHEKCVRRLLKAKANVEARSTVRR